MVGSIHLAAAQPKKEKRAEAFFLGPRAFGNSILNLQSASEMLLINKSGILARALALPTLFLALALALLGGNCGVQGRSLAPMQNNPNQDQDLTLEEAALLAGIEDEVSINFMVDKLFKFN